MSRGCIWQLVKGVIVSFFLSAVFLILLAFLMYRFDLAESIVRGGMIAAYVFSCFVGGMLVSKKQSGKKYLWGMLAGVLYYVILLLGTLLLNKGMPASVSGVVSSGVLCLLGGMLGGMLQAGKN